MIRHAQLLVFTCLACLTHQAASQFAYDGPYYHEVLAGGLVDLPCYLSTHAKRIALKSFNSPIRRSDTLRWVHRRFDNMVDPWTGDGRRSYLKVGILQANDPLVEEMGLLHIPMVSGVGLRIVAVNPSVAGLYACILSTQPFDSGLHLIGENDTLLSIHSLRVKEVDRLTSEEISRRKVKRISVQRTQFEEWTWVVNPSKNILSDGTVFKIDCYADIALTGLVLRRVSGKVVRIGWKFIPRENNTYIDVVNASKDGSEWDLVSPEEFFHSEEDEMEWLRTVSVDEDDEEGDQQGANEDEIAEGDFDILESWTLRTAFLEATMRRWKSRWLRLDRELALRGSGLWQCWLEGIDLYEPKSTKLEHMLITEVRVHVLTPQAIGSEEDADTWRGIAIWTFPICMILFFLIALTAWTASIRWDDLLYHPPMKPKKHEDKKKGDDLEVVQQRKLDYSELEHLHADRNMEVFNFNPEKFMREDLKRQGVPSRKEKGELIW